MKPLGRGCKGNSESLTSPLPRSSHTPSPAATPPHVPMGHLLHPQVTTEPLIGSPEGNHTRNARFSLNRPHTDTPTTHNHTLGQGSPITHAYNKRQLPHTVSHAQFHFKRPYTRCYAHTPINRVHSNARASKTRAHVSPVPPAGCHTHKSPRVRSARPNTAPQPRATRTPPCTPPFLAPPHLWGPRWILRFGSYSYLLLGLTGLRPEQKLQRSQDEAEAGPRLAQASATPHPGGARTQGGDQPGRLRGAATPQAPRAASPRPARRPAGDCRRPRPGLALRSSARPGGARWRGG